MFTGIIEDTGEVISITHDGTNIHFEIKAPFVSELKVDQSISHNGACLTVTEKSDLTYKVTAIKETLDRTNLKHWKYGDLINLERCMKLGERLDGHIVQGHVDTIALCTKIENLNGSWIFEFNYDKKDGFVTVGKGSICVNGVSLTVVDSYPESFSIAIIPYTYEHTSFRNLKIGDEVNIEFDVIGKYVARLLIREA